MRKLSVIVFYFFLMLPAAFVVSVTDSTGQEAPIDPQERRVVETILGDVIKDVMNNYYDPKYHGVDADALFPRRQRTRQSSEVLQPSPGHSRMGIEAVG